MGSKLGTLNEPPTPRSAGISSAGESGPVSFANGSSILLEGSSNRHRHPHSRRPGNGQLSVSGNGQRQRISSTSDTNSQPLGSNDTGTVGSSAPNNVGENNQSRGPASHRQYSLFGHYWDAFLNSDSSSEDDEVEESDDSDSSSDSGRYRRTGQSGNSRSRHSSNRRRHHHHRNNPDFGPFFPSASSDSAAGASAATNSALPSFRIPATAVSPPNALSRASNRRRLRALIAAHSLPFPLFSVSDFKCPICHKTVPSEDIELHVVVCLTKPRIDYNVDVLAEDKGECIICFDEMRSGDTIARLPCLCIYHKRCIDQWFGVRRACPAHPPDDD